MEYSYYDMGESQNHYALCKKPDTKCYILYYFIYVKFLEKQNNGYRRGLCRAGAVSDD